MTRYVVTIEPIRDPNDPAGIRRLRRLLKAMLRGYGIRCVSVGQGDEGRSTHTGSADELGVQKDIQGVTR